MSDQPQSDMQVCSRCNKPRRESSGGLVTQWVSVCTCALVDEKEKQRISVDLCSKCGKRKETGRSGSFTQWIFRADICSCEASELRRHAPPMIRLEHVVSEIEEEELELDSSRFPTQRFKPISELGAGSSGTVYLCRDRLLNKKVAVKILHTLTDEQLVAFQNEAKATSKLRHPHIIDILDFGVTEESVPYMVLEYVKSVSLRDLLDTSGPLEISLAVPMFLQICSGLAYAHANQMLHRDIKPSNVLVVYSESGSLDIRLIDFGLAHGQDGIADADEQSDSQFKMAGTPTYMSPDQPSGLPYDQRSEIYSLGCVMFETITGKPPFTGESSVELIARHASEPPPTLASERLPGELRSAVARCLEKSPGDRFQDIPELEQSLETVLEDLYDTPDDRTDSYRIKRPRRKPVVAFMVLAAFLIAGACYLSLGIPGQTGVSSNTTRQDVSEDTEGRKGAEYEKAILRGDLNPGMVNIYHATDGDFIMSGERRIFKRTNQGGAVTYSAIPMDLKDADLACLKEVSDINALNLQRAGVHGAGLRFVKDKPLESIDLSYTRLDDDAFWYLKEMKSLRTLMLDSVQVSDTALSRISKLEGLSTLTMEDVDLGGRLGFIEPLRSLELVRLSNCKLKDSDVKSLARLPRLMVVHLAGNLDLSDRGLEPLASMRFLQLVNLSELRISKAAIINSLKPEKLRYLRVIWLVRCPGISQEGIEELHKRYPRIAFRAHTYREESGLNDISELLGR